MQGIWQEVQHQTRSYTAVLRRYDVFQVHDIEYGAKEQIINEILPAMHELKQAGKVRFVGITGYPLYILKDVAEAAEVDTVLSYCRYNLMDTTTDDVLAPAAQPRGIGLINASPLHMRVLTEKGLPDWHPAPKRVLKVGRQVADYCRSRGVNIMGSRNSLRVFPTLIKMMEKRQQPFMDLITRIYSFGETEQALRDWDAAPIEFTKILVDLTTNSSERRM